MTQTSKQTAAQLRAQAEEARATVEMAAQTAEELRAQAKEAMAAAKEAEERANNLRIAAARLEHEERRAREAKAYAEHYDRMYREIGEPLAGLSEAQHAIVYEKAYEDGHSSGYGEVETYYGILAEMARKVIEVGK